MKFPEFDPDCLRPGRNGVVTEVEGMAVVKKKKNPDSDVLIG